MPVTMKDVRAALDPEEPDYKKAAKLFPKNPKCTAGAKRLKL